ncbi:MAG: transglycosylase domain-containing protein [Longicatena sp.]
MKNKKKNPLTKRKIFDCVLLVLLIIFLLVGVASLGVIGRIIATTSTKDAVSQMVNQEPSTFYARDNSVIGELGLELRENVTYEQIPQVTIDAFLAIEDSRFYKHNGFDLPRFISSAITNLKTGSFAQGGSTLTMQTVDTFLIKPKEERLQKEGKSQSKVEQIESKLKEIYISMRVENELSKKDIMERYLNQINFGDQARGIQKGAKFFFGKNVEDLNLAESAFLAGCINAPNTYNPYRGYDKKNEQNYYQFATQRRDETLYMMKYHGFISDTEYKLAKNTQLAFQLSGQDTSDTDPYKNCVKLVQEEVIALTGKDPAIVPMKIYTSIDKKAQLEANAISKGEVVGLTNNKQYQIAFTTIENKTGEIIAINPGRSDVEEKLYRARFDELHQPGSAIKPILDYAPTFDKLGWCTSHVFIDKALQIDGRTIRNADGQYHGKVSMERSIAQSLNIPAILSLRATLDTIGYDETIKYLDGFGFSKESTKNLNEQYAIGGSEMQASTTQMAAAYATLANEGNYIAPHTVRKIEFKDNKTEPIETKTTKKAAMSPQAAYMTSDMLYKAVNGRYKNENLMGSIGFGAYPVYGKTGTSEYGDSGLSVGIPLLAMKDEWMINYTSEYTIATWSGFDGAIDKTCYITEDILFANIPGRINKHMLDSISINPVMIPKPSGLSSYGGGLIKTEFLGSAAKNNPLTESYAAAPSDPLQTLIKQVSTYEAKTYGADSFNILQIAIRTAQTVLEKHNPSSSEIANAMNALQGALNGLVANRNTNALISVINQAAALDLSKYTSNSTTALVNIVNAAKVILNSPDSTQAKLDAQTNSVQNAINALATI